MNSEKPSKRVGEKMGTKIEASQHLKKLKKQKEILEKTFGILKTSKTAKELKVELYDELYG